MIPGYYGVLKAGVITVEEQLTQFIFDEVDIGIYKSTIGGQLLYCNPAFLRILGYDSIDDIKEHISHTGDFYHNPVKRETLIKEVIECGKVTATVKFRKKDGQIIIVRLNMKYFNQEKEIIFGFLEDITYSYYYTINLNKNLNSIVKAFSKTTEIRDSYTALHQKNVTRVAMIISQKIELVRDMQMCIRYASLIHDVGKIHIPSEILNKSSKLSTLEMDMIKLHVSFGYEMIKSVKFDCQPSVAEIIFQHHERLDGSGYPRGLRGEQICLGARIIAVADIFDAMCAHRPYRPALGAEAALKELCTYSGIRYDKNIVEVLINEIETKGHICAYYQT